MPAQSSRQPANCRRTSRHTLLSALIAGAAATALLWGTVFPASTHAEDWQSRLAARRISSRTTQFHSYAGVEFEIADAAVCRVIAPNHAAPTAPWIWRARFWDHEPELDVELLKRGFHLAYCDVADLYGAPRAVDRWQKFYQLLVECGLNPKPVIEGMSRGGLIAFNWAKTYPAQVAAIYADNPVCDIRSWPGRKSPADWQRCLEAYGLKSEDVAGFRGNPLDGLEPLAAGKIPVLLVVGEQDDVVPPADNAYALAARYRKLGAPARLWIKPGQGHHPHGLSPVEPLLHAVLSAAGQPIGKPLSMKRLVEAERILVLGDSITYAGDYVAHFIAWAQRKHGLPADRFTNLGLPSETVSGLSEPNHAGGRFARPDLHERLERVLTQLQPDLVFACYGMNCGILEPLDERRFAAYRSGIERLKTAVEAHGASLALLTPPVFDGQRSPDRAAYADVLDAYANWLLSRAETGWEVIDLHFAMQCQLALERSLVPDFTYQPDAVHPDDAGHRVLATAWIRAFEPGFAPAELESPVHMQAFEAIRVQLRDGQARWLEATGHRRPDIPGYRPEPGASGTPDPERR